MTCAGTCGGLTTLSSGDHPILVVNGTLGNFDIGTIARGELATIDPDRQNLNQLQVKNTAGAGTLTAIYTDTSYANLGPTFLLAASTTIDSQIEPARRTSRGWAVRQTLCLRQR